MIRDGSRVRVHAHRPAARVEMPLPWALRCGAAHEERIAAVLDRVVFVVDEDLCARHELVHAFAEGELRELEEVAPGARRFAYARGRGFYLLDDRRVVHEADQAWFTSRGQAWCLGWR